MPKMSNEFKSALKFAISQIEKSISTLTWRDDMEVQVGYEIENDAYEGVQCKLCEILDDEHTLTVDTSLIYALKIEREWLDKCKIFAYNVNFVTLCLVIFATH